MMHSFSAPALLCCQTIKKPFAPLPVATGFITVGRFINSPMDLKQLLLLLLGLFGLVFLLLIATAAANASVIPGTDCVAVLAVDGVISSSSSRGFMSEQSVSPSEVSSLLEEASKDGSIKSVLLEINSPGGSAVASKEIFDELADFDKPVVAYLGEEAASGGYYVAAAADEIVSNPNTLTGSIGARFEVLNYAELFSKIGVQQESIKSGELKDIGAPYRNMTPEERTLLSSLINQTFENFLSDVRQARNGKLKEPFFSRILDGRVIGAKEALSAGMVDSLGNRKAALRRAAELGGIKLEEDELPEECVLSKPATLGELLSGLSASNDLASILRGLAGLSSMKKTRISYS